MMKVGMPQKRHARGVMWKRLLKWGFLVLIIIVACVVGYCWDLSKKIETRFSGRRWSIPSRVFSDIMILYPGQTIDLALLHEKLRHLGYREGAHKPERKGECRISRSTIELFLNDLEIPSRTREGFPVKISLSPNRIESITRFDRDEPVPILELEPEEIMLFFGPEREQRQLVSIGQVPQHLIHAVLAAEDSRFYRHRGVDPRSMLRALYTNIRHASLRQGGSTITQQLAKNYFLTPEKKLSRKLKELLISITMEVMYEKSEILEIYLNEIYLGHKGSVSINGIGEAAYFYFGKPVAQLSLAEAATIAGLIKGPNYYSPYSNRRRCQTRRNAVLSAMNAHGWISDHDLQATLASPIKTLSFKTYGKKAPYFIDYLSAQLTAFYPPEVLSSLGYSIYTTLDTQVQLAAEEALERGLARLEKLNPSLNRSDPEKKLQGAVIVMQPKTGYVLAMVGGRSYGVSQFNRITQAWRQPGSAFKPLVFISALDRFTPCSPLSNEPKTYELDGKSWKPENFELISEERVSVRDALARSINLATVDLAMKIGLEHIVNTARTFQFSTPLKPYPSLALGAYEVIPLELARAFCAFAADGVLPYPLSLKAVVDENGNILQRRHMTIKGIISPAKAFIMTSMLQSAVTEGTARSLRTMGVTYPVAGKTGTTNNFRDAWFVGYTPDILALVWVGFDDGASIQATGSAAALPIWAELIKAIPRYVSGNWFRMPAGVVRRNVCVGSGQLPIPGICPETVEEVFLADNVPAHTCRMHRRVSPVKKKVEKDENLNANF